MQMTPSSIMSPTLELPASLSPVESGSLVEAHQSRGAHKLLCESPRRRRIDQSMPVAFLSTFPEEEWERHRGELERKTGEAWTRVFFMESSWSIIRRYGAQSVMRPIMRDVIEKMVESTESDGLTESVTEESAEESPIMRDQPIRRTKKGLRKYKSMVRKVKERVNDKVTNTMSGGRKPQQW